MMNVFTKLVAFPRGKTKETRDTTVICYFDLLFVKNVPHILEKIFLNLDFDSFNECLRVKITWNKVLNSQSFQKRAKLVFQKDIADYEQRLWRAAKKGDAGVVKRLLENPMLDVNHMEKEWVWSEISTTPLTMAAKYGHGDVAKLLINKGGKKTHASPTMLM